MGEVLRFQYIRTPTYPHDANAVLENTFRDMSVLANMFTVRYHSPEGMRYEVHPSARSFVKMMLGLDSRHCMYHEVVFDQPQKLKFDIDAPPEVIADEATYERCVTRIIEAIHTAFFITYDRVPHIIRCDSVGPGPHKKFSTHLIIDGVYVTSAMQAQEFTRRVVRYIPPEFLRALDLSVNKSIQSFRILTSHKGDMRVKTAIMDADVECRGMVTENFVLRTLITQVAGCEALPDLVVNLPARHDDTELTEVDVENVLQLCADADLLTDHKLHSVRGGLFIFNRLKSSYCDLCKRNHDSDNTLFVTAYQRDGMFVVWRTCRRKDKDVPAVRLGEFPGHLHQPEAPRVVEVVDAEGQVVERIIVDKPVSFVNREIAKAVGRAHTRQGTQFDNIGPAALIYDEPSLRDFDLARTIVVQAQMKMGKTKTLKRFLANHFTDGLVKNVIRFVSFRQTFSSNIKENFPDFETYSEIRGEITHDHARVIVQVESMHRLAVGIEPPDLVILDECEAIWEQFESGLLRSQGEAFAKFHYLLKYARCVILMDANITDRTWNLIHKLRGGEGLHFHRNMHQNAQEYTYEMTGDRQKFLSQLRSSLESGEKVAVQSSSLGEAKALRAQVLEWFPQKMVKLYSSETLASEKREHFARVNLYWAQLDVLIYTPTITAGVSFELKHFDRCFAIFTDQSCPAETCVQMIGRIRDVGDKNCFILINATGANLPVTAESITGALYGRRENLMSRFDETGLRLEYGAKGEAIYHTTPYFDLWLENTRMRNLSRNDFVHRLVSILREAGASVVDVPDDAFMAQCPYETEELIAMCERFVALRDGIKQQTAESIAAAADMSDEEIEDLRVRMRAQEDISMDQIRAWEKYRLRTDYDYQGEITVGWVQQYQPSRMRRIYKNLRRVCVKADTREALTVIQDEERAGYEYAMGVLDGDTDERAQQHDINKRYVFDQHRYSLGLLRIMGWNSLGDTRFRHCRDIAQNIRAQGNLFWEQLPKACGEMNLKYQFVPHTNDDAELALLATTEVNRILQIMYGMSVRRDMANQELYQLSLNKAFRLTPAEEGFNVELNC